VFAVPVGLFGLGRKTIFVRRQHREVVAVIHERHFHGAGSEEERHQLVNYEGGRAHHDLVARSQKHMP
jgi:hypothetical protein